MNLPWMTFRIAIRTSRIRAAVVPCDGEGDDQQDDRRHQPADVRDEPPEEHDDRERAGQGHTEEDQEESFRGAVERGDHRGPTQVAADPLEGDMSTGRDLVAAPGVGRRERPDPRLVAVHHEEEGQERAQDRDGRDSADVSGDPVSRGREPALDALDDPFDREPDSGGIDRSASLAWSVARPCSAHRGIARHTARRRAR